MSEAGDRLITAYDVAPWFCSSGIKSFCAANSLDYSILLSPGYPESVLRATGDQLVVNFLDEFLTGVDRGQQ